MFRGPIRFATVAAAALILALSSIAAGPHIAHAQRAIPAAVARPYPSSPYSSSPYSDVEVLELANGALPMFANSVIIDDDEEEGETIVIRDLKELPEEMREGLDQLPKPQREQIEAAIRERGLKLPKSMVTPQARGQAADPAQQAAAQLLSQFSELKGISRSAGDVLAARAEQLKAAGSTAAKPDPAKAKEPLTLETLLGGGAGPDFEVLHGRIIAGDWVGLQKQLAKLPPDVADPIYERMLGLLSSADGALVPHEILDLADAAPKKLKRRHIHTLGSMLQKSLATVDEPTRFLDRLSRGNRHLGGKDPALRLAAARLLLDAGLTDEVAKYLVPLEEARKRNDADQLNVHGALVLQQAHGMDDEPGEVLLERSWDLFQQVLRTADPKSVGYREAVEQVTQLLGMISQEVSGPWLRQTYEKNPPLGMQILSQIIDGLGDSSGNHGNDEAQLETLRSLKGAMQQLAAAAKSQPEIWLPALQLAAAEWCKGIAAVLKAEQNQRNEQRNYARASNRSGYSSFESDSPPTSAEETAEALTIVPDEACLAVVEPETAWKARKLIGQFTARIRAKSECFASIKLFAAHDPAIAQHLAETYLQHWAEQFQQSQNQDRQQSYSMHYGLGGSPYYTQHYSPQGAVPLTRARQVRNLADMRVLLDELAGLGVKKLDENTLVAVFTQCHSPAEVYRREDIEKVFGAVDEQQESVVVTLVSAMRNNLAGQWRKPDLQEANHTNRTDAELVAEIGRGYSLALDMLRGVVERDSAPPAAHVMLGNLYFDQAEFLYGQKVDLKTYIETRDRAFTQYRLAHESYAQTIGGLPTPPDASIYLQWFQSAMGASDLAYLSRQDEPDRDQIDQVAASIKSLGPEVAERHLDLFGKQASESIGQVPAHLKPWFIREALRIVGDHPSGKPLTELADLYRDLLNEVELHIRVDGSSTVGREPFGAHLVIRGTTAVMREGQSFAVLLSQGYSYATNQQVNHKEKLEKEIREKFAETFEVQQVRFHEPTVEPQTFGRDDWRELPLAYLVLKAKDPAIDRIPSIDLDMEYTDGQGFVVLPIHSPVQLMDARSTPVSRPLAELKIKQTLDDRKLDKNQLKLEIAATGKGLIPELDRVLQLGDLRDTQAASGFKITDVVDHGITIGGLDASSDKVRPNCERRWTIEMAPREGARPTEFAFPKATAGDAELTFVRFEDADLATSGPVATLRTGPFALRDWLWPTVGAVAILTIILVMIIMIRRAQRSRTMATARYRRPSTVTPFSTISLLKQLVADSTLAFTADERGDLSTAIRQLEDHYFARADGVGASTNGHTELDALLGNWLHKAAKPI